MSFEIKNFTIKANNSKTLFNDLSFTLDKGEVLVIQGVSGCGKSTLLKCIAGFIDVENNSYSKQNNRKWFQEDGEIICQGDILLDNINISHKDPRKRELGYLMQNSKIYPHLKTPKEVLEFLYSINKRIKKKYTKNDFSKKAQKIFDSLDFHIEYDSDISNLSGGEEQRLLLAKYFLLEPKLLLLDEPFSNLDYLQREKIRDIIKEKISNNDIAIDYVIMVSHDINDGKIADKILYFKKSKSPITSFDFHIIKGNCYETAFNVFSRLYGNWLDKNNRIVKDNIISDIINNSTNKKLYTRLFENFLKTFNISKQKSDILFKTVLNKNYNSDIELEKSVKNTIYPLDQTLYEQALINRSNTIYEEIESYINSEEKILDVGCGDGRVANLIYNNKSKNIFLTDIYKHPNLDKNLVSLPFTKMEDISTLPYEDNTFDTSLLITVLHHSDNPFELLKEVKRVTKNKIIIIESILGIDKNNNGKFNIFNDQRIEYARLIDWLYNRIVYDDDVNVPYNFLCVKDWKITFNEINLEVIKEVDLGIDIKVVPEHHYLFVLEKKYE